MPDRLPALRAELARWSEAGRVAHLWLRDDDAVEPTAALDRLLRLAGRHAVPATLAVIPARAKPTLAERLATVNSVAIAVHGWAHENHAPADEKKQELGHLATEIVLEQLARAKSVIDRLFGWQAMAILVPPWNRIDRTLLPALSGLGFVALSVYGRASPAPIRIVNAHIDPIDWHAGRGSKDHGVLDSQLARELRWRREVGSTEPVGLLTHHLVHDARVWAFLEMLFEATSENPACRWRSARDLTQAP